MKIKKLKPLLIEIFKKHGLTNDHAIISSNALINSSKFSEMKN